MRRKAKARKRARAQRQAQDAARRRHAQTAAARAANSARNHPAIRAHDALVLPEIARLRGAGFSWRQIAEAFQEQFVTPGDRAGFSWRQIAEAFQEQFVTPGDRAGYRLGDWHAAAVWRIARRHGVA